MRQRGNFGRTWTIVATHAVAGVIGLSMLGCVSDSRNHGQQPARPSWIDTPQDGVGERTLVGVGVGSTRDAAIDAAMARLAQAIEVRIIVDEAARTTGRTRLVDGERSGMASSSLDRTVRLYVDQRLSGLHIERTWQDPVTAEWSARVSLDRAQAAQSFDRRAGNAVARAESETRLAARSSGWQAMLHRREAMLAAQEALDATHARDALWSEPWEVSLETLRDRLQSIRAAWDAARESLRVAVHWTSVESAAPGRLLAERIADFGVLTLAGDADLLIVCDLDLSTGGAFDGRTRATRWELSLQAMTTDGRRTIVSLRESGSAVSRSDSERAARDAAMRRLDAMIPQFLVELFESEGSI